MGGSGVTKPARLKLLVSDPLADIQDRVLVGHRGHSGLGDLDSLRCPRSSHPPLPILTQFARFEGIVPGGANG